MRDSPRPPSIFPLVNLPLPFPCRTGILRSTNFASFGAHSSPFILCVVFSRRTIHGVLGSHASALTATIHRFILFLRQRLFVTPLRDTRRREGGNVGEETVKNKRKPSLRWKNEKKKEREARAAELWSVERRVFSCGILFNRPLTAIPTILSVDGSSHFAEITPSF